MKGYKTKLASVALLTGLLLIISSTSIFGQNMFCRINDFDGDDKADLAIWRDGTYWIFGSQRGTFVFNWGLPGDKSVTY